jgi:prepilin-type processing-associated H-X9-DG protein
MAKKMETNARRHGWQRQLHSGDEVTWNDPDAGIYSRTGIISVIRFHRGHCATILFTDGHSVEVVLSELS